MNHQFDGSADLMMSMVGAMVIMLAVFVPLAQLEQLTLLDNHTDQAAEQQASQDQLEAAVVEVSLGADGESPAFNWRDSQSGKQVSLPDYAALKKQLDNSRPDAIRLRMDRKVPSGVMQDIVIDTSQLGIAILQSNRTGK